MSARARRIHWPNTITIVRMALVIPVVILTLERTEASSWIAFGAFVVAASTDGLDGYLARRLDLVTATGQMLDPIADKVLVAVSMAALVIVGRFPVWAAVVIVAREVAVTVLRLVASRRGRGFPASPAGKLKTAMQLVAVLLYLVPLAGVWRTMRVVTLAVAVALTIYSGVEYFIRAPVLLKRERV